MEGKEGVKGLVWSIDDVLSRAEREARTLPTAKYLDIAISVARRAEAVEKQAQELPNIYVTKKLELAMESIERWKEAFEYLLRAIYAAEDVTIQIENMKRALGGRASLRTRILMALLIHGELKVKELAKILGKSESTISEAVRFLIEMGYIERGENGLRIRKGIENALFELFDTAYDRLEEEYLLGRDEKE
ncbi:ArsR family transcriptional regulator [Pyrococcus kukulkanii]|uniref:ArsR family transcriptional regulator n=1 Tax=Pyrococcus kukulkanii TaxID=1609559 RepID=A0ABV4T6U3_9EURY